MGIRWLPPILWYLVIFGFSSRTQAELPANIPDFLPHFGEFMVLGFLVARAFRVKTVRGRIFLLLFLAGLALGDEFHQLFVPTRIFSLKDILVDTLGATAGMAILLIFRPGRGSVSLDG